MESNQRKSLTRRSSRSNSIEESINILSSSVNGDKFNIEELSIQVINNTLREEMRPIAWKIFLNILPKDKCFYDWVEIIQTKRRNFEKLCEDEVVKSFTKTLRGEADLNSIKDSPYFKQYETANEELRLLQEKYDFFKSQIVAETLIRLFMVAVINNSPKCYRKVFNILAGIVYSLYPSILHFMGETKEITKEVDSQTLFYFLNNEEHFDSDVFIIFDFLINDGSFYSTATQTRQLGNSLTWEQILTLMPGNENYSNQNKNKIEHISYVLLQLANKDLLKYLVDNKVDVYEIVANMYGSLLTSSICFSQLSYLWDNIFLNSTEDCLLNFLDYVVVSLINNVSSELMTLDGESIQKLLCNYPEKELDLKDIIKKSLKLKERYQDLIKN